MGFIALAGVSAEFGVIMLLYLKQRMDARVAQGKTSADDLLDAIREGAVLRVRPKAMTVAVILGGPVPDHVGQRHRLRSDAAHRRADGRRDDHRAAAVDARDSGGLSADAASA